MESNIKKLCLQYSYLSLEKKDVSDACLSVEKEIAEYMQKHFSNEAEAFYNQPEEKCNTTSDSENIIKKQKTKQKDVKKLYRKIASKIHPDKTSVEEEQILFAEAAEAYEDNDMGKLLEIAGIIRIEIPNLSDESVDILRGNILYLSKEIESMKTTSAWVWYRAQSHEEKIDILEKMVKTMRI